MDRTINSVLNSLIFPFAFSSPLLYLLPLFSSLFSSLSPPYSFSLPLSPLSRISTLSSPLSPPLLSSSPQVPHPSLRALLWDGVCVWLQHARTAGHGHAAGRPKPRPPPEEPSHWTIQQNRWSRDSLFVLFCHVISLFLFDTMTNVHKQPVFSLSVF